MINERYSLVRGGCSGGHLAIEATFCHCRGSPVASNNTFSVPVKKLETKSDSRSGGGRENILFLDARPSLSLTLP